MWCLVVFFLKNEYSGTFVFPFQHPCTQNSAKNKTYLKNFEWQFQLIPQLTPKRPFVSRLMLFFIKMICTASIFAQKISKNSWRYIFYQKLSLNFFRFFGVKLRPEKIRNILLEILFQWIRKKYNSWLYEFFRVSNELKKNVKKFRLDC